MTGASSQASPSPRATIQWFYRADRGHGPAFGRDAPHAAAGALVRSAVAIAGTVGDDLDIADRNGGAVHGGRLPGLFPSARWSARPTLLLVTFLLPVTSLLLGALLLGEAVTPASAAGMALIGFGLAAIDRRLVSRLALRSG